MRSSLISTLSKAQLISPIQEKKLNNIYQTDSRELNPASLLLSQGIFTSAQLVTHLSRLFTLEIIDLYKLNHHSIIQSTKLNALYRKYNAVVLNLDDNNQYLVVSDPTFLYLKKIFQLITNTPLQLLLADYEQLANIIQTITKQIAQNNTQHLLDNKSNIDQELSLKQPKQLSKKEEVQKNLSDEELTTLINSIKNEVIVSEEQTQDDAPITRFIQQLIQQAIEKKTSDIHFEPYENSYRIRFRCDGILVEHHHLPLSLSRRLSTKLKIMSKLDISERRLPQDGRVKLQLDNDIHIDIRLSSLPTIWGEKIVLRLLDSAKSNLQIDKLGFNNKQKTLYLEALKRPQGMILITGPTGSGKTVSLYSALTLLNTSEKNISTVEDPIEINLSGINQVQVNPKIDLTFSKTLRAVLRQDPDIIMIGEIRDTETAKIAIKAAQTGHLVFSTLHTNSASEAITRLTDIGISHFNLTSSLSLIIAQRLARRLCPHCKQPDPLSKHIQKEHNLDNSSPIFIENPKGCSFCINGFSGRIGIYEMLPLNKELSALISDGESSEKIEQTAIKQGMDTLLISGIEHLENGITSYQELTRVLYF